MSDKIKERGWNSLIKLFLHVKTSKQFDELAQLIFTHEERNALALRIELLRALLKGEKTQRVISKELNISIAKITRGSNALKSISDRLKKFLVEKL